MPRVVWECSKCGHEASAYDEIDHECIYTDENGKEVITEYVSEGDEMAGSADDAMDRMKEGD